jgi:hypothetical protein
MPSNINIRTIRLLTASTTNNLLLGASIYYSIETEKYLHIPLVILSPSIYAGYHIYKNKDNILQWFRKFSQENH